MRDRTVALLSALIALVGLALHNLQVLLVPRAVSGSLAPLPTLGSTAATITLYQAASAVLAVSLTVVLSARLGQRLAASRDLRTEYRGVVGAAAVGSLLPVAGAVAVLAVSGLLSGGPIALSITDLVLAVGAVLRTVIEVPLLVVLGLIGGAALASVRDDGPVGPARTRTESSTSAEPRSEAD